MKAPRALVLALACVTVGWSASMTFSATPVTADSTVPESTLPASTVASSPAPTAWEVIDAPANCMCSDASPFKFLIRKADPTKVLFFFQGGGACFNAETCGKDGPYNKTLAGMDPERLHEGIWDFANPANPFADYSVVYVPYCTGDVHIGNTTHDYGNSVVIHHNGYLNGSTALAYLVNRFPNAAEVVVSGESAGSIPSPLYAGLVHDVLPKAKIMVLADGSGGYSDIPGINAAIGAAWGTPNAVPAWDVNKGLTPEQWSLPGLFVQAHKHAPDIVLARHDYAFDETQVFFAGLSGIPADKLDQLMDRNEAQIEKSGAVLSTFMAPGKEHTVLSRNQFYAETVNGVKLVDWVRTLLTGKDPGDVHCKDCTG